MDKPGIDPVLARQRLLDAADELFYRQGMHRVSIDRVIEKAGVPAETLREAFGSTDELVRAYLRACHTRLQDALANSPATAHPVSASWARSKSRGSRLSNPVFAGARWWPPAPKHYRAKWSRKSSPNTATGYTTCSSILPSRPK
jgi:AcrR family transcriptional regulator